MHRTIPFSGFIRRRSNTYCGLTLAAIAILGVVSAVLAQSGTPTVAFSSAGYAFNWSAGTGAVTITLSAPAANTVTVQVASTNGSAISPQDYGSVAQTATIPAGTTSTTVQFTINNTGQTGTKYFSLALSNPSANATLGNQSAAMVALQGGSTSNATIAFDAPSWTCNEIDGVVTVSATMTGTPSGPVSVSFATSDGTAKTGVNYQATSGTLTWQPSDAGTSKTFSIPLVDDGTIDPTLTVNLSLSNPTNANLGTQQTAVLYILDSDACSPP